MSSGSPRRRWSRTGVALIAAAAAANAVAVVAIARGVHLLRLGKDPARLSEQAFRVIAPALPARVQLVSCQTTEAERNRSTFLGAYFLAPRVVQLDPALEPVAAMDAALERGGAIVVEAKPGTRCASDLEAAIVRSAGPPRRIFNVRMEQR